MFSDMLQIAQKNYSPAVEHTADSAAMFTLYTYSDLDLESQGFVTGSQSFQVLTPSLISPPISVTHIISILSLSNVWHSSITCSNVLSSPTSHIWIWHTLLRDSDHMYDMYSFLYSLLYTVPELRKKDHPPGFHHITLRTMEPLSFLLNATHLNNLSISLFHFLASHCNYFLLLLITFHPYLLSPFKRSVLLSLSLSLQVLPWGIFSGRYINFL